MTTKPIDKMTLTEIAAEIAERLRAFDPTGGAERNGAYVRVWRTNPSALAYRNRTPTVAMPRENAEEYLAILRRGYRVAPAMDQDQTVYRVEYGRMKEAIGYAHMFGARNPAAHGQTWHLTRLEAAQEYLTEQTKRLREAQESQAAALELWQQEQKAAEDSAKSAPVGV